MLPYQKTPHAEDRLAIVGIGGAGLNILHNFGGSSAENVRLYAMAADDRLGRDFGNVEFVRLGGDEGGLATGGDPDRGRSALNHCREKVREMLTGIRVLVMVAGLGGGTGSGAAPLLAEWAKQAGLYLVSVVIMPFGFEGAARRRRAETARGIIERQSDITLCFENDYLEALFSGSSNADELFEHANRLLAQATAAVPFLANSPGLINLGLDDLAAALRGANSRCIFGFGRGFGAARAEEAARTLLQSPLLAYHHSLHAVNGKVLLHVAGGESMALREINRLMDIVQNELGREVEILFGVSVKPVLQDEIRVTLITSVDAAKMPAPATQEDEPQEEKEEEPVPEPELREKPVEPEPECETEAEEMEEVVEEPEPAEEPAEEPGQEQKPAAENRQGFFDLPDFAQPRQATLDLEQTPTIRPPRRRTHAAEVQEIDSRVRDIFEDIDNARPDTAAEDKPAYSQEKRAAAPKADDIDTPPSLRFNDLRDMFPE